MRLPRWLVVSLLSASVLAVLGYGVWWWVTWPERTVTVLFANIAAQDWETARSRFGVCDEALESLALVVALSNAPNAVRISCVTPVSRTLLELLQGRQRF